MLNRHRAWLKLWRSRLDPVVRRILDGIRYLSSPQIWRNSLGAWLAAIQALIALGVAAGVSWAAINMLQDLADRQQRVRVQLAVADAGAALTRASEDALSYARVLAERPTLRRLLEDGDYANLPLFLARFCDSAGVSVCAVTEDGRVLASAGKTVPWSSLLPAIGEQGERFMAAPQDAPDAYLGAVATPSEVPPGFKVVVAQILDDHFAQHLGAQEGVTLHVRSYRNVGSAPPDDFTALHKAALADGHDVVAHIASERLYVASHPVFSATGEGIVLIEARLSSAQLDHEVGMAQQRLLWVAALLAMLALLGGALLARRVTAPAEALTAAAERLGHGDFATSIPVGGPAEIGQLARTMDDMRHNLVALTDTLRQREAEAQAVLAGIVEGIYAVDGERRIRFLNERAAQLLGIPAEQAVGRFCGDVLKPQPVNNELPCERHCPILHARRGGAETAVEYLSARGGNRRMVLTSSGPADGLQVQVLRDETELEAVRRARDTVLANVSHEFRTPLAAQLASIELLRDGLESGDPARLRELVRTLERGTLRLTQLIDNLLESVRIESGQLDVRHQSLDLAEVIDDALATVDPLLHQRGQQVMRALGSGLILQGDAVRLTQVFVNLLANASKFAPEHSTLCIGAERTAGTISAWVDDAGPGLPEGAHESVFERFSRGAVEPAPSGMGLGLAISRSIVERHEGTLSTSRTVDGYTRFALSLPAEDA